MNDSQWTIRKAVEQDLAFIYSTWSRSYRYDSPLGRSCRNSIFFPEYNRVIDWVLSQEDTQVVVASDPVEQHVIFGYMVHQPNILHYVFTKEAFFRFGIAKSLYQHIGCPKVFTHKTLKVKDILEKYPDMTFNPFILFKQEAVSNGKTT